jgi:uncharacterized protein (DUF1499 family)
MIAAWVGFFDALIALALILAGVIGAHFNLTAPFLGFQLFLLGLLFGVLALILGLIGLFRTRRPQWRSAHGRAVVATYLGVILTALLVYLAVGARGYPAINDITTDVNNPPEFVHAATFAQNHGRNLAYDKAKYAQRQLQGYGAVGPLQLAQDPDQCFKEAGTLASDMHGWRVTYTDASTQTIEGVATTSLFHFNDDFVIQCRPAPTGNGSLVEMRSKSRDGEGDVGTNYKRIQAFFTTLSAANARSESKSAAKKPT